MPMSNNWALFSAFSVYILLKANYLDIVTFFNTSPLKVVDREEYLKRATQS